MRVSEVLLDALADAGLTDRELLNAFRAVTAFVIGIIQVDLMEPLSADGDSAAEAIARVLDNASDEMPRMRSIAEASRESTREAEFRAGIRALLDGFTQSGGPTGRDSPRVRHSPGRDANDEAADAQSL